jgi:hypothetical protein
VQTIPALNRDSDWVDLVADICAVLAVQAVATFFRRRLRIVSSGKGSSDIADARGSDSIASNRSIR